MSDDENIGMTPRQQAFLRDNPDVEIAEPLEGDSKAEKAHTKPFDPDLVGIGGWLGLFIMILGYGALRTFTDAVSISIQLDTPNGPYFATTAEEQDFLMKILGVALVDLALRGAVIFNLLWRKVPRSVSIAIVGVWLIWTASYILEILLFDATPRFYVILGAALFSAIWTAYFLTSKRVAATYNASRPEVAEIFK